MSGTVHRHITLLRTRSLVSLVHLACLHVALALHCVRPAWLARTTPARFWFSCFVLVCQACFPFSDPMVCTRSHEVALHLHLRLGLDARFSCERPSLVAIDEIVRALCKPQKDTRLPRALYLCVAIMPVRAPPPRTAQAVPTIPIQSMLGMLSVEKLVLEIATTSTTHAAPTVAILSTQPRSVPPVHSVTSCFDQRCIPKLILPHPCFCCAAVPLAGASPLVSLASRTAVISLIAGSPSLHSKMSRNRSNPHT